MSNKFQLTAIAVALAAVSSGVMADVRLNGGPVAGTNPTNSAVVSIDNLDPGNSVTASINNTGVNVNSQFSNISAGGNTVDGSDLIIPTVRAEYANMSKTFSQDRVDKKVGQVRNVGSQIYDQNKLQFTTSEQTGDQTFTTSQTASAQYDANGVIVPDSLSGPILGSTIDNGFTPTSVDKVQGLTLGRNNTADDYALSISKTDNGVTNTSTVNAAGLTTTGSVIANDITTNKVSGNASNYIQFDADAVKIHGGTSSTTQTLNDSGVRFETTNAGGLAVTTIDQNGLLTVNNIATGNVTATGTVQGTTLTDGTATLTGGNLITTGNVTATDVTATGALNTNTATVAGALNANGGATVVGGLTADTATVTGALNANTATINGALNAGTSTLDALTVTNAATVNGAFIANNGVTVVGGLNADTATINGALNAGASTLDALTVTNAATVNGAFIANNGVTVVGGLNADTATINGALNAGVTTVTDLTANSLTAQDIHFAKSVVNVGQPIGLPNTSPETTQLYTNVNVNGTLTNIYAIYDNTKNGYSYFTQNAQGGYDAFTDTAITASLPRTGNYTGQTTNTTTTQNVDRTGYTVNNQKVEYSSKLSRDTTVAVLGAVTDTQGNTLSANGTATTKQVDLSEQSVATGILGQDANNQDIYGLSVAKKAFDESNQQVSSGTTQIVGDAITAVSSVSTLNADGSTTPVSSNTTTLNGNGLNTTGNVVAKNITADSLAIAGKNVADEFTRVDGRIDTLDTRVTNEVARVDGRIDTVNGRVDTLDTKVNTQISRVDGRIDTVNGRVDTLETAAAAETTRVNQAISEGDAATLASANANTASTAAAIRGEAATEKTRVNGEITRIDTAAATEKTRVNGELAAATTDRAAIRTEFAAADTAIRNAAAAETTRVNNAISTGNATTLASAKSYTDTSSAATLASANAFTTSRFDNLSHRLDDVEKTAYRGVAISLAAQQAIPNLKPGNFAVYGGLGHYEGETAVSVGAATLLDNGRTSISAAFGVAGNEVGGRVGVSYVFGE